MDEKEAAEIIERLRDQATAMQEILADMPPTLERAIELHQKWVLGEEGGIRLQLPNANLQGANLRGANLSEASLREVNLEDANLYEARMARANLTGVDLTKTNLKLASLGGTRGLLKRMRKRSPAGSANEATIEIKRVLLGVGLLVALIGGMCIGALAAQLEEFRVFPRLALAFATGCLVCLITYFVTLLRRLRSIESLTADDDVAARRRREERELRN